MTVDRYSAADIRIVEFDEHVRAQPQMYFQVGRRNPQFATRVLENVLGHASPRCPTRSGAHPPGRSREHRRTFLIKVWRNGHALEQELAGLRPLSAPRDIDPPPGTGTLIAFELDRTYLEQHHAPMLTRQGWTCMGPTATDLRDPDRAALRDRRHESIERVEETLPRAPAKAPRCWAVPARGALCGDHPEPCSPVSS